MVKVVRRAGHASGRHRLGGALARTAGTGRRAGGVAKADRSLWRAVSAASRTKPPAGASVAEMCWPGRGWAADTRARQLAQAHWLTMEYGVDVDRLGAQALWEGNVYRGRHKLVAGDSTACRR